MVVFQKGKPPLDTELNLVQQIQNVINQRQMTGLPSGWLSLRELYTSMSLVNKFYTQNPTNAIPEFALVNGSVIYVTNTGTTETNSNLIDLGTPPTTGNRVHGVYLEVWRALIDPANDNNKPDPAQIIDSLMDIDAMDENFGWVVGENGLILSTQNGGQTWSVQAIDTKRKLNGVYFITSSIGWVVGDNGVIARTSSGGARWALLQNTSTENLNSVYAISQLVGWAVGNAGTILKTTNGTTWLPLVSGSTKNLNGTYFHDTLTGWTVGDAGIILKTVNGGTSWVSLTSGTANNLRSVTFFDLNFGFAVGDGGVILRTSDGGLSWVIQSGNIFNGVSYSTITTDLTDVSIAPTLDRFENGEEVSSQFSGSNKNFTVLNVPITRGNGKGEITNNPSDVRVTVNGTDALVDSVNGVNGQIILNLAPRAGDVVKAYYYYKCSTSTFSGRVWISGKLGTVLRSDNIGAQWTVQNPVTSYDLNGINFVDESKGWVVGNLSVVRHTENGGTTWATQQSDVVIREVQRDYNEGNIGTTMYLNDDCIHPDVNIETTKRVQIQYKIRVSDNADPSSYPEAGLGSSVIVGLGPNQTGQYPFENMGVSTGDYGLWRARCTNTVDGYCWAVPMFFVNRRNSTAYNAASNTNGSNQKNTTSIRPDLLVATNVIGDDILDVRRRVVLPPVSELLEKNLDLLMSNNFNTRFFRNTFGGDKYGTKILQTDRIGGQASDGGEEIAGATLANVIAGNLSSESTRIIETPPATPAGTTVPVSVPLTIPFGSTGLFDTNPSYFSAVYVSSNSTYNGKPVPGYFTGLGTDTVTFFFSTSANTQTEDVGLIEYQITGAWVKTNSVSLKYIPSNPKLVKNTSGAGAEAFFYQGVLDTSVSGTIEQWDSGIPGYTSSALAYTGKSFSDIDQRNRSSSVLLKFYMKVSSSNISGQNILIIEKSIYPDTGDVPYGISTIHSIKNMVSNFTYKIKNIQNSPAYDKIYVESVTGFPFIVDTVVEITAATVSSVGDSNVRNGASANFNPGLKRVGPFYKSETATVSISVSLPVTNVTIPLSGTLLGVSTTETEISLIQPYCIINNGVTDQLFPVTVMGFGTSSITVDWGSLQYGDVYIQVLLQETAFLYPDDTVSNDGLMVNYYYTPYQSVSDLPSTLELEMVTKPSTVYISNLGTGGGTTGYPYSNPLNHIPVASTTITSEGYFYNLDSIRFHNFRVDTGFAQIMAYIPGSFDQNVTLTLPVLDVLQRPYYSAVSSEFKFESEDLLIGIPRKIFITGIGLVKSSSDGKLLKGEYVLVIFSRHALENTKNYTGFVNGADSVAAIYRLPNKPIVRM
jgi:photosystem II stability/assembly factor-like uncharacterized protein